MIAGLLAPDLARRENSGECRIGGSGGVSQCQLDLMSSISTGHITSFLRSIGSGSAPGAGHFALLPGDILRVHLIEAAGGTVGGFTHQLRATPLPKPCLISPATA